MTFTRDSSRYDSVLWLLFLAVCICYIDRVSISVAIIPMADQFGWSVSTQGAVLSSFFIGYMLLQVVGGRMADRIGGRVVLGVGVLVWSLFTLVTPIAAYAGLAALLGARVGMGLGEAVAFPSITSMITRRAPPTERAGAVGFTSSAVPLGTIVALIATPYIVGAFGWESAFYLFGGAGFIWYALWRGSAWKNGEASSGAELEDRPPIQSAASAPWRGFLKSRAVWALIACHFATNWTGYVLLSWLPVYLNKGLGVDYSTVGWFAVVPHVPSLLCLNAAGRIADQLLRSGVSVGTVRRLMQTIALGGSSVALLFVGYVETAWAATALMAAGTGIGAFAVGGLAVNHMDIAPKHAGTLMGVTNTAATIPGIVGVYVSGWIVEVTDSWLLVFQTAAAVSLSGLLVFLFFSSGNKLFD